MSCFTTFTKPKGWDVRDLKLRPGRPCGQEFTCTAALQVFIFRNYRNTSLLWQMSFLFFFHAFILFPRWRHNKNRLNKHPVQKQIGKFGPKSCRLSSGKPLLSAEPLRQSQCFSSLGLIPASEPERVPSLHRGCGRCCFLFLHIRLTNGPQDRLEGLVWEEERRNEAAAF